VHDEPGKEYYEEEANLLDYWRVLTRYRKLIALIVPVSFGISVVISLLLPTVYASTTRIFAPRQENSLGTGVLEQLPGGLSGLASGTLGGTTADLWVGFLQSQTLRDAMIEMFDLRKLYEAKTIEEARNSFDNRISIKRSKEGIISITLEDKVPERAAEMANAMVEELDRINREAGMSAGRRMRIFVEKRLNEAKVSLVRTEEDLREFQEKYRAIKLDDQSKAIIEAIGLIKGQLMGKEVELQTLLSFATSNNPQVEMLRAEIGALRQRLTELEEGSDLDSSGSQNQDIFIPTSRMPDLSLRYARLLREFKIQETIFELLNQQYEIARVQEAKDSPTVQVLDTAKIPEKKSGPKRRRFIILLTIMGAVISVLMAYFFEYIERLKKKSQVLTDTRDPLNGASS